ncbi:unnamed protein product, partial [Ectocarpus sp. 12 AP-2014]
AFAFIVIALITIPIYIDHHVSSMITQADIREGSSQGLVMAEVRRVAEGLENAVAAGAIPEELARNARADFTDMTARLKSAGQVITGEVTVNILAAAQEYRITVETMNIVMTIAALVVALAGFAYGYMRTDKDFRARNVVEKVVLSILIAAACVAILTTVGIVLSLIFNTIEFFRIYP